MMLVLNPPQRPFSAVITATSTRLSPRRGERPVASSGSVLPCPLSHGGEGVTVGFSAPSVLDLPETGARGQQQRSYLAPISLTASSVVMT